MKVYRMISALILVLPAFAQTTVSRLPDGHPNLTGFWNNANLTPFQRPAGLGEKQYFTAEEAKAFESSRLQEVNRDLPSRHRRTHLLAEQPGSRTHGNGNCRRGIDTVQDSNGGSEVLDA